MASQWLQSWWRGETSQPLRPLLEWLGRYPLLLVFVLVPVCIVWGGFEAMGLPSLFLNDVPRVAINAGFVSALLLAELCFVGYLLDADERWAMAPRPGKAGGVPPSVPWYFFGTGTYPVWLLVLSVPAFVSRHFYFLFGVAAGLAVILFLTRGAEWLQRNYATNRKRYPFIRRFEFFFFRRRQTHLAALHMMQGVLLGLFVAAYLLVALYVKVFDGHGWVSPAIVICVAVGMVAALYGALRFFFPSHHMGALLLGALLFVFVGRGVADVSLYDELSLPQPPAYTSKSLVPVEETKLLGDKAVLRAWLEGMRERPPAGVAWPQEGGLQLVSGHLSAQCEPGPKPRLALVSTSGGGIRAAAWTAHVLSKLESRESGVPDFHRYVRLITGASGGMMGAGAWVAGLEADGTPAGADALPPQVKEDSLSPAAIALLLPFGAGRGRALEEAWKEHTKGRMARTFWELREGEARGWRPSLVYSPMVVEDGRRLLVSNLDLSALTVSRASTLTVEPEEGESGKRARLSLSGVQLFQLFPQKQKQFALAAASRMSASFPYMSPASALPTVPPVRVVDAGYYDNYGVDLAALWLHTHRDWVRECTSGVVLIQIRDHLGTGRRTQLQATKGPVSEVLAGLTSPLEAVLRARESSMSFRNDELLQVLQEELNPKDSCFFTTAIFEFGQTAPLSWALTDRDKKQLQDAADSDAVRLGVKAVREWLTAGPQAQALARGQGQCLGGQGGTQ
jgi:hypothetical protein